MQFEMLYNTTSFNFIFCHLFFALNQLQSGSFLVILQVFGHLPADGRLAVIRDPEKISCSATVTQIPAIHNT